MGKAQKKRQMRRHNPMRVPDSHLPKGLASASASSSKNEDILPIIQKMESVDAAERKWACVAVSNLIQNDPSTRRLLQGKNIVGALITRLSDGEEEVVIEAAGALRNLCIDGGFDICAEMYNKSILTPLKTFVPKISETLSQFLSDPKSSPENAQKVVYEFADNVITILWCLSETSNKAMNAINQIPLVPFLMSFLASRDKLPASTVASAAQCLYVLTDENLPIIEEVHMNAAYTACLLSISSRTVQHQKRMAKTKKSRRRALALRVLCCADLDRDIVLPTLVPVLSLVSLPEASQLAQELIAKEVDLERLETQLRTVQLALEILTGVCATLPDPETTRAGMTQDDEPSTKRRAPPPTFFQALSRRCLYSYSRHPFISPSLRAVATPPTTSALSAIHVGALSPATHNLDVDSGQKAWTELWRALEAVGTAVSGAGQERRREMWEIGVGVLWGVGSVWRGKLTPDAAQVEVLMQLCGTATDARVQVKCIGTLECLAAHPEAVDANRVISAYFVSLLPPAPAVQVTTEPLLQAISALIDLYSDETLPYDTNFRQGRYLDALVASVEGVRKAVRGIDRKKERELRVRGEEVRDNLIAFIAYRRGLGFEL
ncbi:ARM repeat-containing protein [Amylocystis lapponica]|nr:ARM repeat-containing protein [Amylocystis lapponica]